MQKWRQCLLLERNGWFLSGKDREGSIGFREYWQCMFLGTCDSYVCVSIIIICCKLCIMYHALKNNNSNNKYSQRNFKEKAFLNIHTHTHTHMHMHIYVSYMRSESPNINSQGKTPLVKGTPNGQKIMHFCFYDQTKTKPP